MSTAFEDLATLIHSGKLDEAQTTLGKLPSENEQESVEKQFLEGFLQERQGDWESACEAYRAVLDVDSDHTETLFRLAYLLDLHGYDDEAIELYERCINDSPTHVNALMNLSVLYEDHGRYDDALRVMKGVVDQYPNNIRARMFLADIQGSKTMYYDEERERTREIQDALLDTSVSDFELSVRSRNCLKQMNINTLRDLLRATEQTLLAYKNFGETSLNEIKAMLAQKGLRLGQSLEEADVGAGLVETGTTPVSAGEPNLLNRNVGELELSVRSRKCLQRLGITTLGELVEQSEAELLSTKNFGQTSLVEIKRRLTELGLSLRAPTR